MGYPIFYKRSLLMSLGTKGIFAKNKPHASAIFHNNIHTIQ